jgi:hypothetical protein
MDEAHVLKDKGSFGWKNLMAVARHARQRLMLTGTPLQNDLHVSLSEIFCYLLHWCFYSITVQVSCSKLFLLVSIWGCAIHVYLNSVSCASFLFLSISTIPCLLM